MEDWINNFKEIEKMFKQICILLKKQTFDNSQFVECFALTALRMCQNNSGSAKLLLENGFYVELITILRYQLELLFRLNWLNEPESNEEKNKRTNKIEAKIYYYMQKGINNLKNSELEFFNTNLIKETQENINSLKEQKPYLTDKKNVFLYDPGNFIMAGNFTEIFYTHYRYLSTLAHPNPTLNKYFHDSYNCEKINLEELDECLKYSVKVYKHIIEISLNILPSDLENIEKIKEIQNEFNDFAGK